MILKRPYKRDNKRYYMEKSQISAKYQRIQENFNKYIEIHRINNENRERFYKNNMLKYDLYPEQVFLIIKSIEILKFFIDKSFFFNCNKNDLKIKSYDLYFLYHILFIQYTNYVSEETKRKIEKKYDFRNFSNEDMFLDKEFKRRREDKKDHF